MSETTDRIMADLGFPPDARGQYVTELRRLIAGKVDRGLVDFRSYWASALERDHENRARSILATQWEISRGHTYRIECFGSPWGSRLDLKTMKRSFHVRWREIPAWLGDCVRYAAFKLRVWRDRKLLRLSNPYLPTPSSEGDVR